MRDAAPPRVSVLMAVHNDAAHLREAIESISAQTFGDFELIVVDDGSTDGSADVARCCADPRLRLVHNQGNLGLAASLNAGLAIARGEFVARHDADDVSAPARLARQVEYLDRHPDVAVLGTQARYVDETGRRKHVPGGRKTVTPAATRWSSMFGSPLIHGSVMFRTRIVRDLFGGYDAGVRVGQDYELWSRMLRGGHELANLNETLLTYRVRAGSLSSRHDAADRERALGVMTANIAAYAPIPDAAKEWGSIVAAIVYEGRASVGDVRRLAAIMRRMRDAFRQRFPGIAEAELDADVARLLARTSAMLYRRNPCSAVYSLARAIALCPALIGDAARALVFRLAASPTGGPVR